MGKNVWRDPSPDDPDQRRRITRTPEEYRDAVIHIRMSVREYNELYNYARARKATMSYMIREALKEKFPDMFADVNRHIKPPRQKVKAIQDKTVFRHSLIDNTTEIVKTPESK